MITSAADERINEVSTTDDELVVSFADGRTLGIPLVWYPRLLNATQEQRSDWRLIGGGFGVHWPQIDEDLSAAGLLRGVAVPSMRHPDMGASGSKQVSASVESARQFYGMSLAQAKEQLFGSRYALEVLLTQMPEPLESTHAQIRGLIDAIEPIDDALDQAAQAQQVQDIVEQEMSNKLPSSSKGTIPGAPKSPHQSYVVANGERAALPPNRT